jgi:hypothetical protein
VPVAYLTVDDARWLAGVFADLATRAHRRAVAAFFRSTGQVLAELAEDKQDAGERAVFRFRAAGSGARVIGLRCAERGTARR